MDVQESLGCGLGLNTGLRTNEMMEKKTDEVNDCVALEVFLAWDEPEISTPTNK